MSIQLAASGHHTRMNILAPFAIAHAAALRLDETLPLGVVTVPRSLGLPIQAPVAVELKVLETLADAS
jgi:hypothetical protein